jgi:hypothetical protein
MILVGLIPKNDLLQIFQQLPQFGSLAMNLLTQCLAVNELHGYKVRTI